MEFSVETLQAVEIEGGNQGHGNELGQELRRQAGMPEDPVIELVMIGHPSPPLTVAGSSRPPIDGASYRT